MNLCATDGNQNIVLQHRFSAYSIRVAMVLPFMKGLVFSPFEQKDQSFRSFLVLVQSPIKLLKTTI